MQKSTEPRIGILLTNLGTPDAPTPAALRRYLAQFLADPRVVEISRPLWWLILYGFILRLRPKYSAALYHKIWTAEGSPLLVNMNQLTQALEKKLADQPHPKIKIALGMRYGEPSISAALQELQQLNIQQILILPLYPQYSAATTASTFDAVASTLKKWRHIPEIRLIQNYHSEPAYLNALINSIQQYWNNKGRNEHLLFSFHGLPQRFVDAGDPYQTQCLNTAKLVAQALQLTADDWSVAFQSRFGKAKWLEPYCDVTLRSLPILGKKRVDVICPGFSVDCLETLEEIAQQNRDIFMNAGGEEFRYITALNSTASHVEMITALIEKHTQGWLT